ncbi:cytochrome b562 [Rheinheimera sp.]|uniref:cytochrome b562 n=1 Tax=Rheinheimera sp. TaxID=1869214 RepID=UPI002FDEC3CE
MKLLLSRFKKLTLLLSVFSLGCLSLALHAQPLEEQVSAPAVVEATTDVEATMKLMALYYKKALTAVDISQMQNEINALQHEVASVQQYQFPSEKQPVFQKGLMEVQQQLTLVQQTLSTGDLALAKQQLAQVDHLKKQYHKKRSPSFWQLLFGG